MSNISPLEAVRLGLRGSFTLDAASGRAEFGYWLLFMFLVSYGLNQLFSFVFVLVGGVLGSSADASLAFAVMAGLGVLSPLLMLALLPASFCVTVRRLHDLDKSGWWIVLGFVPIVGFLFVLALLFLPSANGRWIDFA